jgi:hypothetical protein
MAKFISTCCLLSFTMFFITCGSNPLSQINTNINGRWKVVEAEYNSMLAGFIISNDTQMVIYGNAGGDVDTICIKKYEVNCYYINKYSGSYFLYFIDDTLIMEMGNIYYPTNDGQNLIGSHWINNYNNDAFYAPSDSFFTAIDSSITTINLSDSSQSIFYMLNGMNERLNYKIWIQDNKLYQKLISGYYVYGNNQPLSAKTKLVRF